MLQTSSVLLDAPPITRSVLFSDVVCSTQLLDEHGELAWLDLVERHADRVSVVARRHAGCLSSFLGDGFMVIFDDPADALAAGIELQLESMQEGLPGIRVGVDHGDLYQFRDEWWIGRTIHLASRLTDLCESGQVVASGHCVQLARVGLALPTSESRLVAIRGFGEPCVVHVFS